jgi:hypothetical protein
MRKLPFFIFAAILILLFGIWLLAMHATANADSEYGQPVGVSFSHYTACDSGRAYFGYPTSANKYKSVKLTPANYDSTFLTGKITAGLDSIGPHVLEIRYFEHGGDSGSAGGWWDNYVLHVSRQTIDAETLAVKKDSSVYQGAASGLSAIDIVQAVLDSASARGILGTGFGWAKDTIFVLRSSDSTPVDMMSVMIRAHGGGMGLAAGSTNVNGKLVVSIDSGYVDYSFYRPGWSISDSNNVHKTTNGHITFYAHQLSTINQVTILANIDTTGSNIHPLYVKYRPVKADSLPFSAEDKVYVGSGNAKVSLIKGWRTITSLTSTFSFPIYSSDVTHATIVLPETTYTTTALYEFVAYYSPSGNNFNNMRTVTAVPDTTYFAPFEN